MKLTLSLGFAFFLVGLCSLVLSADMEDNSVERAKLFALRMDSQSDHLYELSKPFGKNTKHYRLIAKSVGEEKALRLLFLGFLDVQYSYRIQWERNLAVSYLEVFSVGELDSLMREAKKSPYFPKFIENRELVGINAQKRSENIIKAVALKSAEKAFEKFNNSQ
ncbi:MAG TPA: hypothetical protein VIC08_07870 [Cellvibrionaceae bacterium]